MVVDDDSDLRELICFNLEKAGFHCSAAGSGEECLSLLESQRPDLVVLDVLLPGLSGYDVLRRIRDQIRGRDLPVLLLTVKGHESDRVKGFELGADDYVTKPFSVHELNLRLAALLALTRGQRSRRMLTCHPITMILESHEAFLDEEPLELTATEFKLLSYLIRSQGRVLSREQLLQNVWDYRASGMSRTVDTFIQRVRKKLGRYSNQIQTVRGIGYKIEPAD